jgi:hypothetical protein
LVEALYREVGFARSLLASEMPDGRLKLLDGHRRRDLDPDTEVEVLDVSDEEARRGVPPGEKGKSDSVSECADSLSTGHEKPTKGGNHETILDRRGRGCSMEGRGGAVTGSGDQGVWCRAGEPG